MLKTPKTTLVFVLLLLRPALLSGADLKPGTLQAWNDYVRQAQTRTQDGFQGQAPFLLVDETPGLRERVRAGEVLVEPEGGKSPHDVFHGLIHDWVGVVFVPNARLDDVMDVLNRYERYQDYYRPMVAKSSVLEQGTDSARVRLLMVQKAYSVTAAIQADDNVRLVRLDGTRAYSVSTSFRVREIAGYGKPGAHALPQDHGPGYVWRTFTVTRLEERDGGTYTEMEMIVLSRGIPWTLRWLVEPLAEHLPRTILGAMLRDTRAAVDDQLRRGSSITEVQPRAPDHQ